MILVSQSVSQSVSQWLWRSFLVSLFVLAVAFGGPLHLSHLPLAIQHLTSLPFYYVFGYWISKRKNLGKIQKMNRVFVCCLTVAAGLYLLYYWRNQALFTQDLVVHTFLRYGNGMVMSLLLVRLIAFFEMRRFGTLAKIGENSLYIYLVHTYFLAIIVVVMRKMALNLSPFVSLIILFTLALLLSLLATIVVKKIPLLDKIFTGRLIK
ncbi:MAG: acyltransferase family protein [Streptococcus orisratti]|nr:acyltransferase family protein [Streptococcus orisratti]